MKAILISLVILFTCHLSSAFEPSDSTNKHIPYKEWETEFKLKNGMTLTYNRPKAFDFVTKVPKDMWGFVNTPSIKKYYWNTRYCTHLCNFN